MPDVDARAKTMKAWICQAYGGPEVLALEDRALPQTGDDEVLIRIHASTVASGDVRIRAFNLPRGFGLIGRLLLGIRRPRQPILGTDLAGTVVAIGRSVTAFRPGDAVIGFAGASMRCHAEYRVMRVPGPIATKPANLSFEAAASLLFGGMTALHFLRRSGIKAGDRLLVIGASGAVGSAMVQLGRHQGARVTGVTSTRNIGLVRDLGAAAVIDYTQGDYTGTRDTYDIIADTVGASSFARCRAALREHGRYLSLAGGLSDMLARRSGTKRSLGGPAAEPPEDVAELALLAEIGALKPLIDTVYDFADLPRAHAHAETGHKRGSVVVRMAPDG